MDLQMVEYIVSQAPNFIFALLMTYILYKNNRDLMHELSETNKAIMSMFEKEVNEDNKK